MKIRMLALALFGTMVPLSMQAQGTAVEPGPAEKVKMRVQNGVNVKDVKVGLQFKEDRLEIYSVGNGGKEFLKGLPYAEIEGADYAVSGGFPGFGFLGKGEKHWFTIRCGEKTALLRLDKSSQERIRSLFTRHAGVTVKDSTLLSSRSFHFPASL